MSRGIVEIGDVIGRGLSVPLCVTLGPPIQITVGLGEEGVFRIGMAHGLISPLKCLARPNGRRWTCARFAMLSRLRLR